MTTEQWFDSLTAELLAQNPFRRSEYFKRFSAGTLSREQVWGHIAQHYLLDRVVSPYLQRHPHALRGFRGS
jgi:hypothetical protein